MPSVGGHSNECNISLRKLVHDSKKLIFVHSRDVVEFIAYDEFSTF